MCLTLVGLRRGYHIGVMGDSGGKFLIFIFHVYNSFTKELRELMVEKEFFPL